MLHAARPELLAAEIAVLACVLVQTLEEVAGRDVVVHDRLPLRQLGDLAEHVVAHGVMY